MSGVTDETGLIIAIDGPSAAGKSTAAKSLARRLGYIYVESGAFYRALGWKMLSQHSDPNDEATLRTLCDTTRIEIARNGEKVNILVDGQDVTDEVRSPEISRVAAKISANPVVRDPMLRVQRDMDKHGGIVMEGRDIGTVVFPHADAKFYLDADTKVRGERRYRELRDKGMAVELQGTIDEIVERDRQDMTRAVAPLRKAEDAIAIDSTDLTLEEVVARMVGAISLLRAEMSQ